MDSGLNRSVEEKNSLGSLNKPELKLIMVPLEQFMML